MFFLKYLPTQSLILNYREHFADGAEADIAGQLEMLRKASLLLRDLEEFFRAHDFSLTRFLICVILDGAGASGGLTHTQIVERVDVSSPVISRSLKALVEEGLVSVQIGPANPRVKTHTLSDAGKACLDKLLPGYFEILLKGR